MSNPVPYVPNVSMGQAMRASQSQLNRALIQAAIISTRGDAKEELAEAFNPFSADRKAEQKALAERPSQALKREELMHAQRVVSKEEAQDLANLFNGRNPELPADQLMTMRERVLGKGGTAEELLEEILHYFPDPSLADEALDFLLSSTYGDVAHRLLEAKALLMQRLQREVIAGHNIKEEALEYSRTGIGTPTELRNLYRDITGNPREHNQLFNELSSEYGYDRLKEVIDFLFHALGKDLKAQGPSIPRGLLYRLMTEVRVLQSILGVYRFFMAREDIISKLAAEYELTRPDHLSFELLAREFMGLVEDRYPNAAKILRLAHQLDIDDDLIMQIIIFQQFRDAIRGVAPRIYRSLKQRYDLLTAIIEALEELEEELEEEEEEDEADGDV